MTSPVVPIVPDPAKKGIDFAAVLNSVVGLQSLFKKGTKTSEFYLGIVGFVSALLSAFFGSDHGLSRHASDLATVASILIPLGYGFVRAITKHAQAKVAVALIAANPALAKAA